MHPLLTAIGVSLMYLIRPCFYLNPQVLLKNVVIAILVIADSADNCIKEVYMLKR
jgi:hypothetical protein